MHNCLLIRSWSLLLFITELKRRFLLKKHVCKPVCLDSLKKFFCFHLNFLVIGIFVSYKNRTNTANYRSRNTASYRKTWCILHFPYLNLSHSLTLLIFILSFRSYFKKVILKLFSSISFLAGGGGGENFVQVCFTYSQTEIYTSSRNFVTINS